MPTNTPSRAKLPIMIAAWLLVAVIALVGSGLAGNAHAQAGSDVIPSITLDSNQPGQLVITWATPEQAPTDYRIRWANTNLGFPSYSAANEPERGNEYPLVDVNMLTLSNLTPGDSYKVQIRSRYYNADGSVHESSGPWTNLATQQVKYHPPAVPTGLTASNVQHNSLTLTWDNPQAENITGYRVLRGTDAGTLSTLANTQSDSTSYTDSTVEPETTYRYAVVALSQDGNSVQSSTLSATTPAEPSSGEEEETREPPKKEDPPQRVGPRQSTTTTFISNTGQTSNADLTTTRATAFTTGTSTYTLSSVGIHLGAQSGTPTPLVQIYGDTSDNPGSVVATLSNPGSITDNAVNTYTDPANTTLSASTTYWVVTSNSAATNGQGLQVSTINNDNLDSGTAAGWTIGSALYKTNITFTSWLTSTRRHLFEIRGTRTDAASGVPAITAPNVFRVPAVLGVDLSGITDTDGVTNIATNATYKWQRFNAAGTTLETDSIGTGSTYTLTHTDATKTLKVVVNFTDDASNSEGPLTSAATSAITAAATDCNAPTYVGGATQLGPARTVTIAQGNDSIHGLAYGFRKSDAYGSLDNTTFTTGTAYEILGIYNVKTLTYIRLDKALTRPNQRQLALHVCDQAYSFGPELSDFGYSFSNPHQDWSPYAERTFYLSQDTTAPTFVSATVNGTTLVITLNEPLDDALNLANSAFTVKKNGSSTPISSTTPVISGRTVTLTLTRAVSTSDTNVLVSYNKPTSGTASKLRDTFHNETATFTDQVVSNTAATGAPTISGIAQVGQTLTASTTSISDTNGLPSVFKYQWKRVDANGTSNSTNIGTDSATYTLTDSEVGKKVLVEVSFTDNANNREGPLVSAAFPSSGTVSAAPSEVPSSWSLKPTGLAVGDQFRLIFLSSTKRNATSTDIADYNTFVQERAAAGHAGIQSYSTGFRVVGCTGAVDARDNTDTTGRGVPIYWLDGTKVADNYADFYDGSWDDEINDKNESGTDAHDTSQSDNYPFTGCMDNGTESFAGATRPRSLGAPLGFVRIGRPNSSEGPIDGNDVADTAATRPMYGLSAVFQVVAASTDATLSALTVSPKDITGFATDHSTRYEVGVASTVTQATITETTNESAATVGYSTTDADDSTSGHQVDLSAGRNAVTVTVTAEDTTTTQTYTISINRGVDTAFGWKATDDFDGLITAGNDTPSGPWSDGTTMWVSDYVDDKIYAYDLTTKARDASKDFDTLADAGNDVPDGIWSNNITMWVSDFLDNKLYAYSMATKARDPGKDITTAAASAGIWSDGTTMWVANQSLVKIQAYTLATGVRDAGKDFDTLTHAGNEYPGGIWSNTTTMWVTDQTDNKIYAYNMASKAHDAGKDFDTLSTADNDRGVGIWANTDTMWVSDFQDDKIYSYNMPAIAANTAPTVANAIPDQMATVGTEFSYEFPANTFNDVDVTDNLTYTAKKADDSTLPTWLEFDNTTRIFSGTPTAAETVSVKVTASDSTTSVSDEFDITVRAATTTTDVWTATLTPAATITGFIGCYDNSCATGLSDDDFTYDSTDYTITVLYVITDSSRLTITLDPDITTATNSLTLVVGTSSFAFASANTATTDTRTWTSTGLSWTIGTDVSVKLIEAANTPAAGAPEITAPNAFRVPAVLGVDLSGITDTDGVTNIAANATYKWQRFNAAGTMLETDSIGTDATYTLTDTDATKTLKVVVNFTDDASNSEGPLTSAATSEIIAAATCNTPTYVGGATQLGPARKIVLEPLTLGILAWWGFNKAGAAGTVAGSIDNGSFTIDSVDYEILSVAVETEREWLVVLDEAIPTNTQKTIAVHFCDEDIGFASVTPREVSGVHYYKGPRQSQNWSKHAERTIYLSQDTAAPTFTSATVNGSTLVVTLSEDLGTAASLANGPFTVKKGSSGTTQTLSGTPSISGSTVTLTLATAVTATDTAVKVAYAKPTSGSANKLRDKFGNETATFPDQVVTNNTPAADVWTATLTPADLSSGILGCDNSNITVAEACSTSSVLSDDDFPYDSTNYHVTALSLINSSGSLTLSLNTDITTATDGLTLVVGSDSFTLASADDSTDASVRIWNATGLTWTAGTAVAVKLIEPSSDATLSALTVSPIDIIGFTPDRASYEVGVFSTVFQSTITPTTNDSAATVGYSNTDADGTTDGHQVGLSAGRNRVKVTVTAEDTTTTQDYDLSLNRGVTAAFGWKASDDFDGLITAENQSPSGLWSDGTTMWVADYGDDKIYAYVLATKARDASKDFDTLSAADNHAPYGIWSNTTTMWVADYDDAKLYAYNMATKARDAGKDITTAALSAGIWSDGTTMWVAKQTPAQIHAYTLATGVRDAGKDFDTLDAANNDHPAGMWSNNITMWVTDQDNDKLYAYNMASKERDAAKDFDTLNAAQNNGGEGIWANTDTMWVADLGDDRIYSYNMPAIAANTPAAGAPAVTAPNVYRVPAVLGVDLSGITDTDGTVTIAATATYKWQRFDAMGTTLEADSIGTDPTYTLTDTDATKKLKVVVNFTDDASNSEGPLTSAATSAITAAASCHTPTYVGGATQIWTGKLGVKSYSILHGFNHQQEGSSLEPPTFTTASSNVYEIEVLSNVASSTSMAIRTDPAISATDKRTLVLHICTQGPYEFRLSPSTGINHAFSNTGQDWSIHAERTIYLSQDTAAPTFTSARVNGSTLVVTLSEDLAAAASLVNSAFTVKKGGSGTTQTLSGTPSISGSTVTLTLATAVTASDTAVKIAYTKPMSGSANKLKDGFSNETATFPDQAVTNNTTVTAEVPADWGLKPTDVAAGSQFRLIFLSSTKRNAMSTDIAEYNTFVQGLAAAGHTDIRTHSTGFRAVGCTEAVDARDNTATTGTGVPIYWLDGTKVADDYADFYDGDWDDEANDKNESGTDGPDTSQQANYPFTGCNDDGTEEFLFVDSVALGRVSAHIGRPNSSGSDHGPISSNTATVRANTRPMYGLSGLFQVAAAITSTDATLSTLTVSPKAITGFASDRTSYEIGVASTVTQATIVPTTNDSSATVGYSTTDADGTTSGHQVNLSAGRNAVTVTVTAEDTITTQTYTLSINRGVDTDFGWKASDDFDGLITAENEIAWGIWSDGTTMWVTDSTDDKLYAYVLDTKARDASKDFNTLSAAGNQLPYDIWSDNITMWVADLTDDKLYAYNMVTKARDADKDIPTINRPTGIWSNGTTMWVAKQITPKLYAYDMSTKARDASKDFDTLATAGNSYPGGIWSNNTTMWVSDEDNDKLYAYNMASKARDAGKDFNTLIAAGNNGGNGIWANTDTAWLSDTTDAKIYSYNMPAIAANTPAAGAPSITAPNVFRVPAVLGVDLSGITDADGTVTIAATATYKWQRFDATGNTLETDSIGTDATYTLTDTDATKTLKVVVNFTDDASNSEGPLASAATSAITAAATCAAPTYVGGATQLGPARTGGVEQFTIAGFTVWGFSATESAGSLDNTTFTTEASNDYQILEVATGGVSIFVSLDKILTAAEKSTLVLHVCDQARAFAPVTNPTTTPAIYTFLNSGLDWSDHAERTIYLSQDTAAPTFASATVNGSTLVVTFNEDLGAAGSLVNSAFTVKKGTSGTTQTLSGTPSISGSTVTLTLATAVTATDTAVKVAYTKPTSGSANKLIDKFGNEMVTFPDQAVTNNTTATAEVPASWSLKPTALNTGDQFRLIFLSSTKRNADVTTISTYNTFVQNRAAAGHTAIRAYSAGFRVVGCTADVDARDNTSTTFTTEDKGVPIYWLNGAKVADEYEDFYDGDWDDEINDKDESGTNGLDISLNVNSPFTGCAHNGTEALDGSISQGFAAAGGTKIGRPNSTGSGHGPLSSNAVGTTTDTRPMYGISGVFQVAEPTNTAPMVANAIPDQAATVGTAFSYQFPATTFNDTDGTDTLTYSAKQADDSALPTWLTFTDTTRTFSGNPTAAGTVSVKVTASDGTASVSDEFDITVQFTTFISNTGQSSSHASAQVRATAFTTGTGTYTLSSVRIYHGLQSSVTPQVQIYSDASGEPGTVVATMSNLGTIALGVNIYPAPANTTLSASTIYWVVTSNSAATDGQGFRVNTTPTNNLDSGTAAGWNIGNARYKDDITATSWSAISGERLRFQIRGTAGTTTNTAAAGAPAITAPNVFRVPAVLGVDLSGITDTDGVTGIAANATYKWQRFNAAGTTLDTDNIGTNATYTLTDTDATKTLKVVVNFTDDASNSEGPLTSAATSAITAAASCAAPTYVGGAAQIWTAKVGVGKNTDFYGYYDDTSLDFGSLDQTRFSISSNNYRMDRVFTQPGPSLAFSMKSDFTSDEQKTLTLHICDQAFAFSVAGAPSSGSTYAFLESAFPGADLDWSTHAERTVYLSEDTAAPTFASATVNGSTLVVTLNEDLGAAADLANSAFTVKKGSSGTAQTLSGTPSISGSTVTLTLATAVTATDTAVKVAYTKPTSGSANKLIDKFGNETATFTDQPVTNTTVATRVLVSNTGQTGNSETVISAAEQAQAFTTGATSSTVTSVTIRSEDSEGDDVALKICETTGSSIPTTTCTDLTPPGTYPSGLLVFTAPDMALNATTTYSVVFSSPDGEGVTLDATDSDNEDTSSSPGWSIRNRSQVKNPNWQDRGHDRAIIIAINGTIPNVAATGTPTISGTAQVSRTLTTSTSGIRDPNGLPSTFNYQWKRYAADGNTFESNIGVNSRTYTLTTAEEGKKVRVEVTFNDNSNNSEGPLLSAAYPGTGTVSAAPMPLAVTQQEDRRYAFTESDFSNLPSGVVQLSRLIITELPDYGWLARGKTVLLPSGNRQLQSDRIYSRHLPLTLVSEDNRKLRITFFPEANGNGTPYASFKFKVNSSTDVHTMLINVTPVNDPAYGRVFITGPAQVGYELTAFTSSMGDRDGIPRDQLSYQWKRYAANGTTFETNIGANSSTYRVTDNDVGKKIKLEVRFTDNEGTDEGPLTSPAFPYIATQTIGEATFISTIGMVGDSYRSFTTQEQGQVFTTGGNPNGYTVTSVVIISEDSAGDDVGLKICEVDESLHPTAVCTDLTAPGMYPAGPLVFTAPSGTTLTGGRTNYMVVFDSPGDENVRLDAHKSDGYGSDSLPGFSIRNRIHYKTGSGWQELSYRQGIRMAVLGTINP